MGKEGKGQAKEHEQRTYEYGQVGGTVEKGKTTVTEQQKILKKERIIPKNDEIIQDWEFHVLNRIGHKIIRTCYYLV